MRKIIAPELTLIASCRRALKAYDAYQTDHEDTAEVIAEAVRTYHEAVCEKPSE